MYMFVIMYICCIWQLVLQDMHQQKDNQVGVENGCT